MNTKSKTKKIAKVLAILALLLAGSAEAHTLRLADGENVSLAALVKDLRQARVVFIGESHDSLAHHRTQLEIIRALREAGEDLAIGLEMFRSDSQEALDRWVAGEIGVVKFMAVYHDNWQWWDKYSLIFNYARENRVEMIGLNLSRQIVAKVARNGFDSLSQVEKEELPVVRCVVDDAYRAYIRRALGKHDLQGTAFDNFCEAQLLWDKMMARNLLDYLADHPDKKVVVLAGSGHAWKYGIPAQLKAGGEKNWREGAGIGRNRADFQTLLALRA
ncbi:MAG: ChaN family lipoprotein [Desulfobulbaceae bacterium]|nr:ChaN family lipoprotein [Desulfobulbaceae bacterium]